MNNFKILTFTGAYLPGYKGGGPIRTIANMAAHLGDEFEFWIVTRDRDLGDTEKYPSIPENTWVKIENTHVYYLSPDKLNLLDISKLISNTPHDILYLNSFFEPNFTIKPLLSRRFLSSTKKPVILAPRGEFSPSALQLKKTKKYFYITISKLIRLYKDVTFQASSAHEEKDINKSLNPQPGCIITAIDLPEKNAYPNLITPPLQIDQCGALKVIFLSRISPMKNLDFALNTLALTSKRISFDIYGPLEDQNYWKECQAIIKKLPTNISVNYCGTVLPANVKTTFGLYDLFLFPTRGENYGHVIAESFSAGTPVLLSDKTPWSDLENDGLGWNLSLENPAAFAQKIEDLAETSSETRQKQRLKTREKALTRLLNPEAIEENRKLFYSHLPDHASAFGQKYHSESIG